MSENSGVEVRTSDQKVQLGCGTLIIIAIIVMIFSGGSNERKLRKEIRELHEKVDRLEQKIDALAAASSAPVQQQAAPPTGTTDAPGSD